jgi:hypothetical protein
MKIRFYKLEITGVTVPVRRFTFAVKKDYVSSNTINYNLHKE